MKVERRRDPEGFPGIQEVWNAVLHSSDQDHPFLSYEWIFSWWKCFSEDNSLEMLLMKEESGHPVGIAPLMMQKNTLRFIASEEVSDYCDFVVEKGRHEEFFNNVLNHIQTTHADIEKIDLMNIKSTSPTLDILPRVASEWGYSSSCAEIEVAPLLELPSSYGDYLGSLSKKKRHELRRKLRRMESLEGIRVEKITDTKNLPDSIDKFIDLHKRRSPSKANFWKKKNMTDFFHGMAHQFSLKRWVEMNVLFLEDRMLAALLNFAFLDRIYFYNVAFDKDFARYSPGIYLFNHSIQDAISTGIKSVDFLRGREDYKYYFGAEDSKIFRLVLMPGKSS
jgi:CelD/BcsL family acetyltransferase involved in cellulose biosynthesis